MPAIRIVTMAGMVLGLAATLTSCRNTERDPPPALTAPVTPSPTAALMGHCLGPDRARLLALPIRDTHVNVGVLGTGSTGVVLAYERNGRVCTWLTLAEQLVTRGYRVALFDYTEVQDAGQDVGLVVARLRTDGVRKVFLVGGSRGGSAALHAGVDVTPPVAAVVNIAGGLPDGEAEARLLRVPLLLIAARDDSMLLSLGQPAPALLGRIYQAAAHSPDRQLLLVDGTEHASELFRGPAAGQVTDAVLTFLHRHGGP
jgi:pimeloyl-ACP methyl ester carboxylesterase